MVESLQASLSATTRQVASHFKVDRSIKSSRQAEYTIRCWTCPQCLEAAVRSIPALDLKLNDKASPSHYARQAGVRRSLVSFL